LAVATWKAGLFTSRNALPTQPSFNCSAVLAACQDPDIARFTSVPVPYLAEHAAGFVGVAVATKLVRRATVMP
jgi:hypothetical protein